MTPDQIAAAVVDAQLGVPAKPWQTRCLTTIEVRAHNPRTGSYFVKANGDLRSGHTLRDSTRLPADFRQRITGEQA